LRCQFAPFDTTIVGESAALNAMKMSLLES
jgi:hypothetical protein